MTIGAATRPAADSPPRQRADSGHRPPRLRFADSGGLMLGLGALALAVAALFGAEMALIVLGTVLGGLLVVSALVRPAIALVVIVVLEFSNAGEVVAVPGMFAGMLGLGMLSILVALRLPEMRARLRRPPWAPVLLMACYLVTLVPSIRYTLAPNSTDMWLEYLLKDCLLLVIVLVLAQLVNRPWWIAATIVVTLGVIAALTIVNQVALGALPSTFGGFATVTEALGEQITTPRHAGPVTDANFWGRNLILALPLAFALTHRSAAAGRWLPVVGWSVMIAVLLGGLYLTQSRGSLLSALVAIVVWVVASGPRVRRAGLLASPLALLVMLIPGVGNRLINLSEAFEDVPAYAIDPSLVQRSAAQEIAAIVFADKPLFGTGPGSFASIIYEYSSQSGDLLIGPTRAQHNTYLEVASESGVVGLVGWMILVAGIAVLACRSVLRLAGAPDDGRLGAPTRTLAAGLLAVVVGWSTASLFLHVEYFRPVLIVLALVGLVAHRTKDSAARHTAAEAEAIRRATKGLLAGGTVAVMAVAAAGLLAAAMFAILNEPRYRVEALFTLLPAQGTYIAYGIDVRNRVPVLPAYAAMIDSSPAAAEVRVDAEPEKGVLTLTSFGATLEEAEATLAPAIADAPAAIARYRGDLQYRLVPLTRPEVTIEPYYSPRTIGITVGAVAVELMLLALLVGHIRRRGRAPRAGAPGASALGR
ncbi:O-antigen ligase family protein [Pseudonocardia nigra]|uniref:O-antigen ligase family protein n=1 Tax=Pseudonocardia nigra TaxID=1921578 RepID=UPI001C5F3EBF|nr:O-antigen ligase family protein [Pseudonocardia nigra]